MEPGASGVEDTPVAVIDNRVGILRLGLPCFPWLPATALNECEAVTAHNERGAVTALNKREAATAHNKRGAVTLETRKDNTTA